MIMIEKPTITVVHQLPGRIRLRLSHDLKDADLVGRRVCRHAGIHSFKYTALTRSVVVNFDLFEVSAHEIIVRLACSLALEHGGASIRVLAAPEVGELSDSAVYSAILLAVAGIARVTRPPAGISPVFDWAAGISVAGAVLLHGWDELRRQGYVDPEVVSVVYLLGSLIRGQALPGAVVVWLTTFGRHLVKPPLRGVELRMIQPVGRPRPLDEGCEIIAGPDRTEAPGIRALRFLPELIRYALGGGAGRADQGMLGQINRLARLHDSVLEGLGESKFGIPIRVSGM
jgi:hypothetical protein